MIFKKIWSYGLLVYFSPRWLHGKNVVKNVMATKPKTQTGRVKFQMILVLMMEWIVINVLHSDFIKVFDAQ